MTTRRSHQDAQVDTTCHRRKRKRPTFARLAAPEWTVIGMSLLTVHFVKALRMLNPLEVDFAIFHQAARQVLHGGTLMLAAPLINYNPPHFMALVLPFAILPLWLAFVCWTLLNVVLADGLRRLIFRELAFPPELTAFFCALGITLAATQAIVRLGQISLWIALFVTAGWIAARHGRDLLAGFWIGVALSVKPFLLVLLPLFLIRGRWRIAVVAVSIAIVAIISGGVMFGTEALREWTALLTRIPRIGWWTHFLNASIPGMFARAGWSPTIGLVASAVVAASALVVAARVDEDRAWAAMLTVSLLCSPLGWVYYLPLMAGPILAIVRKGQMAPGWRLLLAGFLFPPFSVTAFQLHGRALAVTAGSVYVWSLIGLLIAILTARGEPLRPHLVTGAVSNAAARYGEGS